MVLIEAIRQATKPYAVFQEEGAKILFAPGLGQYFVIISEAGPFAQCRHFDTYDKAKAYLEEKKKEMESELQLYWFQN